jgi:hypothetical protein
MLLGFYIDFSLPQEHRYLTSVFWVKCSCTGNINLPVAQMYLVSWNSSNSVVLSPTFFALFSIFTRESGPALLTNTMRKNNHRGDSHVRTNGECLYRVN